MKTDLAWEVELQVDLASEGLQLFWLTRVLSSALGL